MDILEDDEELEKKPRRGRPPGKGNRLTPISKLPTWSNYVVPPKMDYRYEDIQTLVARQLSMVGLAQDRIREEMIGVDKDGKKTYMGDKTITSMDIERLMDLSATLVRSIDALQRCTKVAEELQKKLTPEQVLEAAIMKIQAQEPHTLSDIIKRLNRYRLKHPKTNVRSMTIAAADSIADLEK